MSDVLARLKQRKLVQWALAYVAAAFALLQGIDIVAQRFGWPDAVERSLIIVICLGFFIVLLLAWYHGERGAQKVSSVELLILALLLAIGGGALWRFAGAPTTAPTVLAGVAGPRAGIQPASAASIPDKSIAVLPLANESGDPKQQYFVDGMSEELITDLAQVNGLKVIGKDSSFKFRNSQDSPAQIGATLGVAHLIHGSVFQQGNRIRVTVSMIRAKDGGIVWSHNYDEQLNDVFAIQTQIGHAVAAALKIQLLRNAIVSTDEPPSGNVEAYRLLLQGRALVGHATEASIRQGIALLQQALKLDPDYATAWDTLSGAWVSLGEFVLTGDAQQQAYAQARVASDRAQLLAPDAASTYATQGYLLGLVDHDLVGAQVEYQRAYALAPNNGSTMSALAIGYQTLGQLQPAVELFRKAIATDPLRPYFYGNLASALLAQGQLDAAEQAAHQALALQSDYLQLYSTLAQIDILRGNAAAAVRDSRRETHPVAGPWIRAMAQQIGPDHKQADAALHAYLTKYGKDQPYTVAELYGLREQPNEMFAWLQRAWTQHDPNLFAYGSLINGGLLADPFITRAYEGDPRFAALRKQAGLPITTDAKATP
jgi:serine/threonine-protein kinase